jgi:hypothetical protein
MATDAVGMALSTFIGSATGAQVWVHLALLCLWSLVAGLLVAVGRRGAVLGTQAIIAVVVFGRFSQPPAAALGIAGLVLAGGRPKCCFSSWSAGPHRYALSAWPRQPPIECSASSPPGRRTRPRCQPRQPWTTHKTRLRPAPCSATRC